MNPEQAKQALFVLNGHWPNPKMEPPEIAIWAGYSKNWTLDEFSAAIRKVTLVADRPPFRPVPSEIAQLISAQRRRAIPDTPELPNGARPCTPAESVEAIDRILTKWSTTTHITLGGE